MENKKIEIENVFSQTDHYVTHDISRIQVPGGWLITYALKVRDEISTALCFLPDPDYDWELMEDESE